MRQRQFLDVVDEATAHARFDAATAHLVPQVEDVALSDALGRVLAEALRAGVDVPAFDRSNVDGFAVRAVDTFGAEELEPVRLRLSPLSLGAGETPPEGFEVEPGVAVPIATGGVVPRGADAIVMVEHTVPPAEGADDTVLVLKSAAPGARVTWAGTDLGRGEIVLQRGQVLGSRETGLAAAVGTERVPVFARPRVAVLSTGDEIVAPGRPLVLGQVYDSNGRILADAVTELGGQPVPCGIQPDDEARLRARFEELLHGDDAADIVLLSGGTSKGQGDLNGRVLAALCDEDPDWPGILVHGVALKPGKPICLAVVAGKPVIVLPGFPTSAIFTFHEFVAPLIARLAGRRAATHATTQATAPLRIPSAVGRTEYTLVNLVEGRAGLAAYPLGAGSGSVSTFSRADGFVRVPHDVEYVNEGAQVEVRLLGDGARPADLVAIGSHCVGLDLLLALLAERGFTVKAISIGSAGGLRALERGEGDVAGTHLLDAATGEFNVAFLPAGCRLTNGYGRRQGIVFRRGDARFTGRSVEELTEVVRDGSVRMVNRNPGSGTRVLIDRILGDVEPPGFRTQARSHHAVAAAVAQGRADWGMTLDVLAREAGLDFTFVQPEQFQLAVAEERWERPAVAALRDLLVDDEVRARLGALGLVV